MTKSLLAGAAALALIAGAALAQDATDTTVSRTTTTQTLPVAGDATVTKVQKTFDPYSGTTTQRVETTHEVNPASVTTTTTSAPTPLYSGTSQTTTVAPVTTQKSYTTETTTPVESSTTYSKTTTTVDK